MIPVNPRETEILGEKSFKSLADVPVPVDIVNVFRAPDALPAIAAEAVTIGAGNLWCQFTVINEEGARIAEAGGLSVVMDRCIKVEHARYVGRMHWLGFNTQRITGGGGREGGGRGEGGRGGGRRGERRARSCPARRRRARRPR